jgi:hypothetical protein
VEWCFTGSKYISGFSYTITETSNVAGARHYGTVVASHSKITKASPTPYESLRNRITAVVLWTQWYPSGITLTLVRWNAANLVLYREHRHRKCSFSSSDRGCKCVCVCVCVCVLYIYIYIYIYYETSGLFIYKYVDFYSDLNSVIILGVLYPGGNYFEYMTGYRLTGTTFSDFCQSV